MLPAHAGMIPRPERIPGIVTSAPRTCGDDPMAHDLAVTQQVCSPHMRG